MNILVTGGAGFVGSSLIAELVKDKSLEVYSLDNYFTGTIKNHVEGAHYIKGDCGAIDVWVDFIPDVIFHFGEYSRVSTSFEDLKTVWNFNIKGTYQVLEFCKKYKCKLIYSASSTKFADNGKNKNESPYAFFKSQNTDLIKNYNKWFDLDYAICYFYNVYGNRQIKTGKYATVIGIFEEQYLNHQTLTVVEPGYQTRDFTHIDDIVRGLMLLMTKGKGDGYCFGTGKSYQMTEVAKFFKDDYCLIDARIGERFESSIDLKKTYELGWTSQRNLEDYIHSFKRNNINV